MRGQAIVEFALVVPLFLLLLLGFGEVAFMAASRVGYQNGADVLAAWAAHEMAEQPGDSWHDGWGRVVGQEMARVDCSGAVDVLFPDGDHERGDRVLIRLHCHYAPRLTTIWPGLSMTVQSEAVVPGVRDASPSPPTSSNGTDPSGGSPTSPEPDGSGELSAPSRATGTTLIPTTLGPIARMTGRSRTRPFSIPRSMTRSSPFGSRSPTSCA